MLLGNHRLAHAEVNALLAADFRGQDPRSCTLYASTEPCPMCTGAAVMANVKHITYASRDPWAGGVDLLGASEYLRRQKARATPPQDPTLEALLVAMQVDWHTGGNAERAKQLVEAWRAIVPQGVALGERLHSSGVLRAWTAEGHGVGVVA